MAHPTEVTDPQPEPATEVSVTADSGQCPTCDVSLVSEPDETPWCARCEWKLDSYVPADDMSWVSRSIRVRDQRLAYRADLRMATEPPRRPGRGEFAFLCGLSAVLFCLPLALVAIGIWLIVVGFGPIIMAGIILILLAYPLRPRLGSVRRYLKHLYRVDSDRAPELHALIERVANATGAPRPDVVALDVYSWNASTAVLGLRARRVLTLGVPLMASLTPAETVALIGHELGHFANGDARRSLLTQPALTTFGRFARLFAPPAGSADEHGHFLVAAWFYNIWQLIGGAIAYAFFTLHLAVHVLASRDLRRAEQQADLVATRAGGTAATLTLLDAMAAQPLITPLISGVTRRGYAMRDWQSLITANRGRNADRTARMRQLTIRNEASLFASHPPAGRRYQFVAAQPEQPAAVVLSDAEFGRITRELGPFAERLRDDLAEQHEM